MKDYYWDNYAVRVESCVFYSGKFLIDFCLKESNWQKGICSLRIEMKCLCFKIQGIYCDGDTLQKYLEVPILFIIFNMHAFYYEISFL